jgi:uncharacterized protein (TIGR03067 family)
MTRTFAVLALVLFGCFTIGRAAEPGDAAKGDQGKLQGEWKMVSGMADGQAMPEEMLGTAKRVCKDDETTVMIGEQLLMKAKFTLDPSKTPKTIDYDMIDGFTKGQKQLGIYEFDGQTVRFAFAAPGEQRPADFSSKAGDRRTVSVWKKVEKAEK